MLALIDSTFCRYDGGFDAADIPTDMPPDQLKQLMVTTYKTEVVVDEKKATRIPLLTMHVPNDKDTSTVLLCKRAVRSLLNLRIPAATMLWPFMRQLQQNV